MSAFIVILLQSLFLPRCIIAELHRQLRQRRYLHRYARVVETCEFPAQNVSGPGVPDNVMHHDMQYMFRIGELQQTDVKQRAFIELEAVLSQTC